MSTSRKNLCGKMIFLSLAVIFIGLTPLETSFCCSSWLESKPDPGADFVFSSEEHSLDLFAEDSQKKLKGIEEDNLLGF